MWLVRARSTSQADNNRQADDGWTDDTSQLVQKASAQPTGKGVYYTTSRLRLKLKKINRKVRPSIIGGTETWLLPNASTAVIRCLVYLNRYGDAGTAEIVDEAVEAWPCAVLKSLMF